MFPSSHPRPISSYFQVASHFRQEFRKQLRTIILFTAGFSVAFAWRETFFDAIEAIIQFFSPTITLTSASILTSTIITLFALLVVLLSSHLFASTSPN